MSKGSAPPAPDYTGAAQATAAGNLENLNAQTVANRPDQYTPWGSSTWTSTPNSDGTTSWTNNLTLSLAEQSALDSQQAIQQNQSSLAQTMQGQVANTMKNGFTAPSMDSYMSGVPAVNANFAGFYPSGVGAVDQRNINPSAYTAGYGGLSQNFNSGAQQATSFNGGPSLNTSFGTNTPGLNTTFNSGTPSINNTFSSSAPGVYTQLQSSASNINTNFNSGTPGVNTTFSSGANPVNQNFASSAGALQNTAGDVKVNTDPSAYTAQAGNVNLGAPQFDQSTADAGAQAAYKSSTGLLTDQWDQDNKNLDSQLRLQGLTPGTEAYNNAMQNQLRVQGQQKDQLANQAVVTGNQLANTNYASALAGYQAGNAAQNQAYSQGLNNFTAANTALGQQFNQSLSNAQLNNTAAGQQYSQDLQGFNANNAAQQQQFGQDATGFGLTNDARNQAFQNSLSGFNANNAALGQQYSQDLQGFNANNAAQNQAFTQDATGFGLTNDARNQSYANALSGYNATNAARSTQFGQDLSAANFNNTATNQQFQNNLAGYNAVNSANNTQYQNDLAKFNANNNASTQSLQNGLAQYAAALQGQSAYNSAAGQAYNQALGTYGANQAAQESSNAAQSQAYQQAMAQYQTAYQNAYQNYLQPLNSMNAVLTGQQVAMPQMPSFASAGYTPGTDYSGAASALGQYNSGVAAQNAANSSSTMGMIGSLGMAAAVAY